MLATIIWLLISVRGLYKWRLNAREAKKNLDALQSNGSETIPVLFARTDRITDNARATAFFLYVLLGFYSLAVVNKWWFLSFVWYRYFGDVLQAVLVFGAFIFMFNGEISGYVTKRVLSDRNDHELAEMEAQRQKVLKKTPVRKTPVRKTTRKGK